MGKPSELRLRVEGTTGPSPLGQRGHRLPLRYPSRPLGACRRSFYGIPRSVGNVSSSSSMGLKMTLAGNQVKTKLPGGRKTALNSKNTCVLRTGRFWQESRGSLQKKTLKSAKVSLKLGGFLPIKVEGFFFFLPWSLTQGQENLSVKGEAGSISARQPLLSHCIYSPPPLCHEHRHSKSTTSMTVCLHKP